MFRLPAARVRRSRSGPLSKMSDASRPEKIGRSGPANPEVPQDHPPDHQRLIGFSHDLFLSASLTKELSLNLKDATFEGRKRGQFLEVGNIFLWRPGIGKPAVDLKTAAVSRPPAAGSALRRHTLLLVVPVGVLIRAPDRIRETATESP